MKKIVAKRPFANKDGTISTTSLATSFETTIKDISDVLERVNIDNPSVQIGKNESNVVGKISLNINTWNLIDPSSQNLSIVPPKGDNLNENVMFKIKNITQSTNAFRIEASADTPIENPAVPGILATRPFYISEAGIKYAWTWLGQLSNRGWWLT